MRFNHSWKMISLTFLYMLLINLSYGQSWTPLNGPSGGLATAVAYDVTFSKVYSIVNSNLFVSSNDGNSWTQIETPNNAYVEGFVMDGSAIMAVMNTNQVQRSTDGGITWTLLYSNGQFAHRRIKKMPQPGGFVVYGDGGAQITMDGGITWKKFLSGFLNCCSSLPNDNFKIASNGDLFIADESVGIRRFFFPANATDLANWNESNWTTVFSSQSSINSDIGIGILSNDKIIINYRSDAEHKTLFSSSSDKGESWQAVPMEGYTNTYPYIGTPIWSLSPNGKIYLFDNNSSNGRKIWEYTDGATTPWAGKGWPTTSIAEQDVHAVAWKNNITAFAGGKSDAIFKSSNTALTWSPSSSGINYGSGFNVAVLNSGKIVYLQGYSPKGYYYSTNNGVLWEFQPFPYSIDQLIELPDNTLMLNAGGYVHHSTDGGITWNSYTSSKYEFRNFIVVAANDIYAISRDGLMRNSIDRGATWTLITINGFPPTSLDGVPSNYILTAAARDNDGFFYAFTFNQYPTPQGFWKINSTVDPWIATSLTAPESSTGGMFTLNNKLYIGNSVSSDKGESWKEFGTGGTLIPILQLSGGIGISTKGNLSITQDDGKTFTNFPIPLEDAIITEIAVDPNGDFIAAAQNSPALKFTNDLILPTNQLPPYIDFNWQPTKGGPYGGAIKKVLKNSTGQVFASGYNGIYKLDPGTNQWNKLSLTSNYDFFIDAADKLYVLNNGELNISVDNGTTFTKKLVDPGIYRGSIVSNLNGDLIVAGNTGILKSVDNGSTFDIISAGSYTRVIASQNGTLLAADETSTAIIRSIDNGVTWTPVTGLNLTPQLTLASISIADGTNFIVLTSNNIYKSIDNGASWVSIQGNLTSLSNNYSSSNFSQSPAGEYVIGSNGIYFSTNGGITWEKRSAQRDISTLTWAGSNIIGAGNGGVFTSNDNGNTFSEIPKGIEELDLRDLILFNDKLFTASRTKLFTTKTNTVEDWSNVDLRLADSSIEGIIRTPDNRLIAYGYGLYQSVDGVTWSTVDSIKSYTGLTTANGIDFYSVDNTLKKISHSTDLKTWVPVPVNGLPNLLYPRPFVADSDGRLYVFNYVSGSQFSVYQIVFGEATELKFITHPRSVVFHNNEILIYDSDGFIHKTNDGVNWEKKVAPVGNELIITALNYYFIPIGERLWVSRDKGLTWQNVGDSGSFFTGITLNEFNGLAYGLVNSHSVKKSSNIIIPDDKTGPVTAGLLPVASSISVLTSTTLSITLNEGSVAVAGKKVKMFLKGSVSPLAELLASDGVRNEKTFTYTLPSALSYLSEYYVIVETGAYVDIFGNPFTGVLNDQTWKFTTVEAPDLINPVITFTPTTLNLDKGVSSKKFTITVTDNKTVAVDKVKISYRKITSALSPVSEVMVPSAISGQFDKELSATLYDEFGLEFYFTAEDAVGNHIRLPADTSYFYSAINHSSSPPTLNGLASGGTLESYRIISVPYLLTDPKIATVLNEVGEPNANAWRMFTYSKGTTPEWIEYPAFTSFERGKGYWINIKAQTEIKIEGATTPGNNKNNFFTMTLQPGWNQVGNPYPSTISWIETKSGNTHANFSTFKKFTSGGFTAVDQVNAFEGGFVYLHDATSKDIKIRFAGFATGGRIQDETINTDVSLSRWTLPLTLTQGLTTTSLSGVGMHPDAKESLDQFDDLNPPRFLKTFEMNFLHPHVLPLALDIVSSQNEYEWNFTVNTEYDGQAEIQWNNSDLGNNSKELYLFDISLQHPVNMREQNHYAFDPKQSSSFRIYYGENLDEKIKPDFVLLGDAYPNPTSGHTIIPFTLPKGNTGYHVKLEMYDLLGKKIATLKDENLSSGFHAAEWHAETSEMTNGFYLYRLFVEGENEHQSQYKKIVLSR